MQEPADQKSRLVVVAAGLHAHARSQWQLAPADHLLAQRYIGIDVHRKNCTVAVVDGTGKHVGQHVVETNGAALLECLKMIPGEPHVCIEEGTQSAWLYEILTPHAQDLAVVNVTESRGPKSDERDAFGLAEKLRVG
jgi:hypothetical protein